MTMHLNQSKSRSKGAKIIQKKELDLDEEDLELLKAIKEKKNQKQGEEESKEEEGREEESKTEEKRAEVLNLGSDTD